MVTPDDQQMILDNERKSIETLKNKNKITAR